MLCAMPWARHCWGSKLSQMAESLSLGILQSIKQNALLADSILLIFTYPVLCDWLDLKNLTLYHSNLFCIMMYFQCGLLSNKESACQCKRLRRHGFYPWVRKISWRKAWQPTPVFLPGESPGQRSLAEYSPRGCKELKKTEAHNSQRSALWNSGKV